MANSHRVVAVYVLVTDVHASTVEQDEQKNARQSPQKAALAHDHSEEKMSVVVRPPGFYGPLQQRTLLEVTISLSEPDSISLREAEERIIVEYWRAVNAMLSGVNADTAIVSVLGLNGRSPERGY